MLSLAQLPVTIRPADAGDEIAIARLAALDSSPVPPAPLLIAEVGGEAWAVLSVRTRVAVADPFRPSAPVVGLLRDYLQRAGGRATEPARARRGRRLIGRLAEVRREVAYAQRRLLEIRTGLDLDPSRHPRSVAELEAWYALDGAEPCR